MSLPSGHIPMGQKILVSLTVKNLDRKEIAYTEGRVYVEGEKGEPRTTLIQRQLTHGLKPGEQEVRKFGFEPLIAPGASITLKYDLSELYEFKEPGKYSVYIEVLDESALETRAGAGLWVRSPVARFEVLARTQ